MANEDTCGEGSRGDGWRDEQGGESLPSWELSRRVIGACIEVHRVCGPGLLESAYEECLSHELRLRGIPFVRQRPVALLYKELVLDAAYRIDFSIDDRIVLEVKSVEVVAPIHLAQVLTYLNLTAIDVGLLVNFNTAYLRDGVRRLRRRARTSRAVQALSRIPWPEDE